jgi:uncharacterized membrane protein
MMESVPSLTELTQKNVELIAKMEKESEVHRTFGERLADYVAAWVGCWTFLIVQSLLLFAWVIVNVVGWWMQWDPYPFILLNLVLSFQAAFASPIILMSQNRQSRLSDRRNRLHLQINLLAEQETTEQIRLLRLLCKKSGIPVAEMQHSGFEEPTRPDEIVQQIKDQMNPTTRIP